MTRSPRPTHYRVVCFSAYLADLEAMDAKVEVLKRRGVTNASRSLLIRLAVRGFDPAAIPCGADLRQPVSPVVVDDTPAATPREGGRIELPGTPDRA